MGLSCPNSTKAQDSLAGGWIPGLLPIPRAERSWDPPARRATKLHQFLVGRCPPWNTGEKVRAPTRGGAAASAELSDRSPGSSPVRPEGTLRLRLGNNRRKKGQKFFPCKTHPHPQAQFAVGSANVLLPLVYRLEKHPQVIHRRWRWGVLMPSVFYPTLSSPLSTCVHRRALHELLKGKMANYAQCTQSACGSPPLLRRPGSPATPG